MHISMQTMKLRLRTRLWQVPLQDAVTEDVYINSIRDLLTGEKLEYTLVTPILLTGEEKLKAVLMGGNLTLLAHAVGGRFRL